MEVGKLLKTLARQGSEGGPGGDGAAGGGPKNAVAAKVGGLFVTRGVTREPLGAPAAGAGDIITVAGIRYDFYVSVQLWCVLHIVCTG